MDDLLHYSQPAIRLASQKSPHECLLSAKHPSGLEVALRELPVPSPKVGERLIRVHAASLNRGELLGQRPTGKPARAELAGEDDVTTGEPLDGSLSREVLRSTQLLDDRSAADSIVAVIFEQGCGGSAGRSLLPTTCRSNRAGCARRSGLIVGASSGVGVASLRMGKLAGRTGGG